MNSQSSYPIVGIGASAGGLEAFTTFFETLPDKPGMAFILIQHLDPHHKSLMPELLSRHTPMNILQVTDRAKIDSDHIYIIPPGKYLEIENNHLVLTEQPASRRKRMAIDHFFITLANSRKERAVCIVMTGTGSDGMMGLKAVKSAGGFAMVQDPRSADFDGMPRNAIRTGVVDRVLKIAEMPEALLQYAKHPYLRHAASQADAHQEENNDKNLDAILSTLRARTGHDFHSYKQNTLRRRIQRRMSFHQLDHMEDYQNFMRKDSSEAKNLFRDLLINVTSFFREPKAWSHFEEVVTPCLLEQCEAEKPFRIWTPGCSTGEEAYTVAILITEILEREKIPCEVNIFATDIDLEALEEARKGYYPFSIQNEVSSERLDRFFIKKEDGYEVRGSIRDKVMFAPQSIIADPPFSMLNFIVCRNLLIYLEAGTQKRIIEMFHFALQDNGHLFLGNSETIGNHGDLFKTLSRKWKIYKKLGTSRPGNIQLPLLRGGDSHNVSSRGEKPQHVKNRSLPKIVQQILVEQFAPAAVMVDSNFDILYYNGPTNEFLLQPQGEPSCNLLDMVSQEFRIRLRHTLNQVVRSKETKITETAQIRQQDGHYTLVEFSVQILPDSPETEGMILVAFRNVNLQPKEGSSATENKLPHQRPDKDTLSQLELELKTTRHELQSTIEELETSNEEMQSTNEELEASKEEMQSLNEELSTVNNELREKLDELEKANADMRNLLVNTKIATLFLDRELNVRRFTPAAKNVFHIIDSDVGRPINHISRRFEDTKLLEDCNRVLETESSIENEIRNDDEAYFLRRTQPYLNAEDQVEGVVLTFVDITNQRSIEKELKEVEKSFRKAIEYSPLPIILYAEDGEVLTLSHTWVEISGYTLQDIPTLEEWTRKAYGKNKGVADDYLEKLFELDSRKDDGQWTIRTKGGEEKVWHFHSSPIGQLPDGRRLVISKALDETELSHWRHKIERYRDDLEEEVRKRTRNVNEKNLQLRRMASQLSQTEQRERQKLSSTLHDNMQQLIAAARLKISMAIEGNEALQKEFIRPLELLSDAAKECRDLAIQLAPPVLYDAGLLAALRWLCDWVEDNHHLEVIQEIQTEEEPEDEEIQTLLFQSVRELLYNVVKHSGQRQCTLRVESADSVWLKITVSDEGNGFNPQKVKTDDTKIGFGLLSIHERLSVAGGFARVESAQDKGTSIHLEAPLLKLNTKPVGYPVTADLTGKPGSIIEGDCTILIADDHTIFRDGLVAMLKEEPNLEVIGQADSGEQAIKLAKYYNPDIILMDVDMPGVDGTEATKRLMQDMPDTCIIALSMLNDTQSITSIMKAGAKKYISKDDPKDSLINAIHEFFPLENKT